MAASFRKKIAIAAGVIGIAGAFSAYGQTDQTLQLQNQLNQILQSLGTAAPGAAGAPFPTSPLPNLSPQQFLLVQPVSIKASPSSPSAGEDVTIQAVVKTFEKYSARFDWTVNGRFRQDLSGTGKDTIKLRAGDLGTAITVSMLATSPDGKNGKASLVIRTSDLALLWSAETYTPKWYRGKALPSQKGFINVTAIPKLIIGGAAVRPENLVYRWSLDNQRDIAVGVGMQVFRFQASAQTNSSHRIQLTVEDVNKKVERRGEMFIKLDRPRTAIYRPTPLGGIEPRRTASLVTAEGNDLLDFQVEPFFFPVKVKNELTYQWAAGGYPVGGAPENPFIASVGTEGLPSAQIPISIRTRAQDARVPAADKAATLIIQ